ncbi:MAG TPA: carbohydrate ABC transporter permease, partial [Verrucomicrobiae bacterium]|nr:carbohydrate ABC transporter permease [Verrucomicrobiae bacterium]
MGHLPALIGARLRRALAAHATLLAGAVLAALPLLWLVSLSLQEPEAVFRYPPRFIPERVLWSSYPAAW